MVSTGFVYDPHRTCQLYTTNLCLKKRGLDVLCKSWPSKSWPSKEVDLRLGFSYTSLQRMQGGAICNSLCSLAVGPPSAATNEQLLACPAFYTGLAEPVRLLRPWPDQFLRLSKIFRAATCSCRLEICVLVACKLSAGDARLM